MHTYFLPLSRTCASTSCLQSSTASIILLSLCSCKNLLWSSFSRCDHITHLPLMKGMAPLLPHTHAPSLSLCLSVCLSLPLGALPSKKWSVPASAPVVMRVTSSTSRYLTSCASSSTSTCASPRAAARGCASSSVRGVPGCSWKACEGFAPLFRRRAFAASPGAPGL